MSTQVRLAIIQAVGATVVCCTPTYALRLAEVAAEDPSGCDLAASNVRILIVAGEPGGSIPATRRQIEERWGARVVDHYGLTEVGPVGFECWEAPGSMHVNEDEYICEVLDPAGERAVPEGEPGELVLTNLGRTASPVIRYRTGDVVVRRTGRCACGRTWARLEGGVLSRADDMVTVRGVNVYPGLIEAVVRGVPDVAEFRAVVSQPGALRSLDVEIELRGEVTDGAAVGARVAQELREALALRVGVRVVPAGALPRFEMKARRLVVEA
jgi:phenylacetate-CoA ligase